MYSLTSAAVIVAMCQMRKLEQDSSHTLELDNLLLVIAQTGVFIYAAFSIIATFFQVYLKAGWETENWIVNGLDRFIQNSIFLKPSI